jgi:hypothetical protein
MLLLSVTDFSRNLKAMLDLVEFNASLLPRIVVIEAVFFHASAY